MIIIYTFLYKFLTNESQQGKRTENEFNTLLSEKNDELQPLDFIEKKKLYLLSFRESIDIPYSFLLLQMSTFTHSYHDIIMPF